MFVDTHCHIDDEKFNDAKIVVDEFVAANVDFAINMGCNVKSSQNGLILSEKYPQIYFGAGFHPSDEKDFNVETEREIVKMAEHKKCVAIGEIGLDYYWQPFDKERQKACFIRQIELANELKLPVSIHCREATEDMVKILKSHELKFGGVMHCFSGSVETAEILLKLGLYISFGGTLTFKNARNLIDVAKIVPLNRCLTETDSPYLAPTPYRGSINSPKYIPLIAEKMAEIKGLGVAEVAEQVKINAKTLFYKITI